MMSAESIEIDLAHPIEVNGEPRSQITVRGLTIDEIKQVRRSAVNKKRRGIAFCQIATGLTRSAVLQLEQADIEAVFAAEVECRDRAIERRAEV